MKDLKNKVAIITGASGGMGRVISEMLADKGVKLALYSNDKAALEELADSLSSKTELVWKVVDVCSEEEVKAAVEEAKAKLGTPEILLNLAGLSIPAKIWDMSVEAYMTTMDVNVKGTFLFSKHFANAADAELGGQIISIGSMAAKRANGNAPLYCTAKAAVNMLSAGMAIQYKEKNIRVTTLNPGGADTPFWGNRPIKRENLLKASDVAEVMEFVLTRESRVAFSEINFESFLMM
ncbi:MAG: SDR family oxidoreductase [Ruminococcaceae bacterium]|nr:SDR family oxidoreductase [Oscillospiraceae bacterium]